MTKGNMAALMPTKMLTVRIRTHKNVMCVMYDVPLAGWLSPTELEIRYYLILCMKMWPAESINICHKPHSRVGGESEFHSPGTRKSSQQAISQAGVCTCVKWCFPLQRRAGLSYNNHLDPQCACQSTADWQLPQNVAIYSRPAHCCRWSKFRFFWKK